MICQRAVDRMRGLLYSAGYEAIDERSMIAIRYTHKPGELLGKPYVPIKLRTSSGNPEIEIAAILNSGADAPVFSIEIAYRLGLSKGDLQGSMDTLLRLRYSGSGIHVWLDSQRGKSSFPF
jgi:hypothetical protein